MGTHSVVEAKNQLSALIKRALKGERVVITRHGQPVVEVRPVADQQRQSTPSSQLEMLEVSEQATSDNPKIMNDAQFDWLERIAIKPTVIGPSAADLIRQMRDEGE